MKKYVSPEVVFVEFDESNRMFFQSYECPNEYGNTCTGNPYGI